MSYTGIVVLLVFQSSYRCSCALGIELSFLYKHQLYDVTLPWLNFDDSPCFRQTNNLDLRGPGLGDAFSRCLKLKLRNFFTGSTRNCGKVRTNALNSLSSAPVLHLSDVFVPSMRLCTWIIPTHLFVLGLVIDSSGKFYLPWYSSLFSRSSLGSLLLIICSNLSNLLVLHNFVAYRFGPS